MFAMRPTTMTRNAVTALHTFRPTSSVVSVRWYATQQKLPQKAAGAFTSNKHIATPITTEKTLVYIGPFGDTLQRYKMVASLFGVCGLCAVPALLSTGQAPTMSIVFAGISALTPAAFVHWYTRGHVTRLMVYDDVRTVEKQRRRPKEMLQQSDKYVGIETCSPVGRLREHNLWLSELNDVSKSGSKAVVWQWKKRYPFILERSIIEADPFLNGLSGIVSKIRK
ncbi:hypothetical protein BCR43DRAFT_485232 [Syncephalastrum racemosum]|uniref:Transmembrane protein n=1 Tax=Syncephalastrum racemosum TaxID=13706 RepID=A0A1X2HM74_SYNRA|nr:hypothetical protein BCR43DRAFT_485232 [Syncephalastrum racemosum]